MTTSVRRQAGRITALALVPALGGALAAGPALASGHTSKHGTSHPSHHTATVTHTDYGSVDDVAGNDSLIKVKTDDHGELTLLVPGKALRQTVDAASVTDYVVFSYQSHKGKLYLKSLRDTSVSDSGTVTAIASDHKLIKIKTDAHGSLDLHVTKLGLLDRIKRGERVDIDYYKSAKGQLELVDIGSRAPIGGGNSGSAGSAGSSGSSGSYGSGGSWGSGSYGSAGSFGSGGDDSADGSDDGSGDGSDDGSDSGDGSHRSA